MFTKIKVGLFVCFSLFSFVVLNYNLPTYKVGHVTGTEVKLVKRRQGMEDNKESPQDVYQIYFRTIPGETLVMRNKDTGFGLPLYLKFNSANIQGDAQSMEEKKSLVAVKYYGWRVSLFSWFPNIIGIEEVQEGDKPISYFAWLVYIFWSIGLSYLAYFIFIRKKSVETPTPALEQEGNPNENS